MKPHYLTRDELVVYCEQLREWVKQAEHTAVDDAGMCCGWCGSSVGQQHSVNCDVFTPEGEVK